MDNVENLTEPVENVMSKSAQKDIEDFELLEKERKVVELRHMGITYEVIAKQVGYASPSGAFHAYERALARYPKETVEKKRELAESRLERLLAGVWTKALRGETTAIMATLKIFERQAKLMGLDAPQKIETDLTVYDGGDDIDEQVRRFAYLIAQAREDNQQGFGNGGAPILAIDSEREPSTTGDELAEMGDPIGARVGQDSVRGGMDSMGSVEEEEKPVGGSSAD
jgi:hypothetical protein